MDYEKMAFRIADNCRIRTKPNPNINKAKKVFGDVFIDTILKKAKILDLDIPIEDKKKFKKLSHVKFGPLVYRDGDNWIVKPAIGEVIRIVYTETDDRCVSLAKEIRKEAWKRGCHVAFIPTSNGESREYLKLSPEHTMTELSPSSVALAKSSDLRIFVGDMEDPLWSHGLEKKLLLSSDSTQVLSAILDKGKVRWAFVGFPVKRKNYLVDPEKFEEVYLDAFEQTFHEKTLELCDYYKKSLKGVDKVEIVADDGTDLKMSIKGRPILVADGIIDDDDLKQGDIGLNIPDGEVFLAPLERSANGKIFFDYISIEGFGFIRNFWLFFKNGKVVDFKGKDEHVKIFKKFLDSNTGEKDRIAELGIGTNLKADFIGTTIIDEKIYGSIHIAIGMNTGSYHGKNKASSHLDMIKIMKGKGGNMFADKKLIMKNGEPVK